MKYQVKVEFDAEDEHQARRYADSLHSFVSKLDTPAKVTGLAESHQYFSEIEYHAPLLSVAQEDE